MVRIARRDRSVLVDAFAGGAGAGGGAWPLSLWSRRRQEIIAAASARARVSTPSVVIPFPSAMISARPPHPIPTAEFLPGARRSTRILRCGGSPVKIISPRFTGTRAGDRRFKLRR